MSPQHFFFSQHIVVLSEISGRKNEHIVMNLSHMACKRITDVKNSCESFTEGKELYVFVTFVKNSHEFFTYVTNTFDFFTRVTDSFDFHIRTKLSHM